MNLPPLSALPPPAAPPSPDPRLRSQVVFGDGDGADGIDRLHPERPAAKLTLAAVTVALVVLVVAAACWALAARLIGPDAWVIVIGFAVVPMALSSSWQRR